MSIMSVLKSPKTTNILTKVVGGTSAALCLYSSHTYGKMKASEHAKDVKAESLTKRYLDGRKLDSPSIIKDRTKGKIFNYFVDESISEFFTTIGGYCKGFGKMMIGNVIPIVLSAGTFVGKGLFSKVCGAGLVAYGGIFLIQEIFGIGKAH